MKHIILLLVFHVFILSLNAQGYTSWIVGDDTDAIVSNFKGGVVLAGGGGDNDEAMKWMLQRAGGGDVLVIRASNSDGYNNYFFQELGVQVNSVETIRFNDESASVDPYVLQRISEAEVLFIAGGDQYDYYQLWRDTPIEDAINNLIKVKGITIGGTSAGMAILGKVYYTPSGGSLDTEEALFNPFHPDVEILGKDDFLDIAILDNVITDTHYDQRDRAGRHLTFLARVLNDFGEQRSFGIACNEYTAVAIDENGKASVYGEWPDYDDYAYFLRSNCSDEYLPEQLEENMPLHWDINNTAVDVLKVAGTASADNWVDLHSPEWESHSGVQLQNWFAIDGVLNQIDVDQAACASIVSIEDEPHADASIAVSPNPFIEMISISFLERKVNDSSYEILTSLGQVVLKGHIDVKDSVIDVSILSSGMYIFKSQNQQIKIQKL